MIRTWLPRFQRAGMSVALLAAVAVGAVTLAAPRPAQAATTQTQTQTYFICPTVSTNNTNGTWVVGTHGGYYVLIPTNGATGSKDYLSVPVTVSSLAQVPAGWGLYSSLPSYPNFAGTAVLLQEGIDTWLGSPAGWQEGNMASVADNGNGTYTVTNLTLGQTVTIDHPIPLASAALW